MKLNKIQMYHIVQIMEERGTGHCKECRDIVEKLKEELERQK